MKIKFENFRCYENKEFDLGENGLILLSGPSGSGKSTILNGIYFALFGEGNKVVSHGKTNCKVQIEHGTGKNYIKIIRTKKPNRVVLEMGDDENPEHMEDQAAQDIINKMYGDMFNSTGYVSQNAINSFILLSPTDKLTFLEQFAFKDLDLSSIKGRCKSVISKRKEQHISSIAKADMTNKVISDMHKPEDPIDFPIKHKSKLTIQVMDKLLKNEETTHKNTIVFINKTTKTIKTFESELNNLKIKQSDIQHKKDLYENTNIKLEKLKAQKIPHIKIFISDNYIEEQENKLKYIKNTKKLEHLKTKLLEDINNLEKSKKQELLNINEELTNIKSTLWQEYKREEIDENINTTKEYIIYIQELTRLNKELKNIPNIKDIKDLENNLIEQRNLLELAKIQDKIYECPKCQEKLTIPTTGHTLLKATLNITVTTSTIQLDIKNIEHKINNILQYNQIKSKIETLKNDPENQYDSELSTDLDELRADLDHLKAYILKQTLNEKRKNILEKNIENGEFSSTLDFLQESVNKQKKVILMLEQPADGIENKIRNSEEEIRNIIETQKQSREKINNIIEQEQILIKEIQDIDLYLEKNVLILSTLENVVVNISEKEEELKILETNLKIHIQTSKEIEKYKKYKTDSDHYNSWIEKKTIIEKTEQTDRLKYASSTLLWEKILESESIAITNIVNSINTHAQIYLDCFFPDNPISVKLLTFKEVQTKKSNIQSKPQINIAIEYKGMECDINTLSGGELARVVLSFTLALAEMFNTPLIMLDECTSSLDQDLSTTIINGIKENFSNKLVIVISHQNVCGIYDRTLAIM